MGNCLIRRYPCRIVLQAVLGILTAKGIAVRRIGGYAHAGILLIVLASGIAVMLAGIWLSFEPVMHRKLWQAFLLGIAFTAAAVRMNAASCRMESCLLGLSDGQEVSAQGRIVKKQYKEVLSEKNLSKENSKTQWTVYLTDSYLRTSHGIQPCENIIVILSAGEPVIGNTILVSGKIKLFAAARNEGNFDERAYYQNQGYALKIYADSGSYQAVGEQTDGVKEFLYKIQQRLLHVYETRMPEAEAGVLCAMLTGEKSLLLDETKQLYRQSGIAHILAISGLHISILGMAAYRLLRRTGASFTAAGAASMALLLLFALMTGMGTSTVRAVVMFGIYLGAACCGRAYDSTNGLAIAAAFLLAQNPRVLFLAGFQFSFAAVAGVLFGKELCGIYKPRLKLVETVIISFGIQMLTLPLTAWYYYEIPVYSVLLNMLVLPFMGLALITGLLGGAAGVLAGIAAASDGGIGLAAVLQQLCGMAGGGLLDLCAGLLKYFSKAGSAFLQLPGAVCVTGQPGMWKMAAYFLLLFGCLLMARYLMRQKLTAGAACLCCLLLLFCRIPRQGQAEVTVLDVGQGDGIYIHTSGGAEVFIDGGSSDVKKAGTYRILPFLKARGISGIDYWFISHLDMDHISGFMEIIESGYEIRQAVFAKSIVQDEAYAETAGLLREHQIKVEYLEKGGSLRGKNASFTCLAPDAAAPSGDRNDDSLVLLYEDSGFRGFFSGDISSTEEEKLLAEGSLADVSFYKAAHHGSKYSNCEALLKRLRPSISVVSCSEKNRYGHPGAEAIAHMEESGSRVYYTMKSGQVQIRQKSVENEKLLEVRQYMHDPTF